MIGNSQCIIFLRLRRRRGIGLQHRRSLGRTRFAISYQGRLFGGHVDGGIARLLCLRSRQHSATSPLHTTFTHPSM